DRKSTRLNSSHLVILYAVCCLKKKTDLYAGLTVPATARPRLRPHEAVREIVKSRHEAFPTALVKALLSEISVFPPGTVVRLNTEEIGRVVAVNRNHPLRPRVEVMADSKGHRL